MKRLLFALIVLLFAVQAQATTRYASTTGATTNCTTMQNIATPASSIAAAVNCSASGDMVHIRGGTYNERIHPFYMSVPSGISPSQRTTIAGYPGETVWLIPTVQEQRSVIATPSNQYVTFDNLRIDATNVTNGESGVSFGSDATVHHIDLTNCEVKNANTWQGFAGSGASGLLTGGDTIRVANCDIHNNGTSLDTGGGGYSVYNAGTNNTFEYNKFRDNVGYGIQSYKSGSSDRNNNVIRYNQIYNNAFGSQINTGGIVMSSGQNNQAYGNVVYSNHGPGIDLYVFQPCINCKVYNNTFVNNAFSGINVPAGATGAFVQNNVMVDNNTANVGTQNFDNGAGASTTKSNNLCFGTGGSVNCSSSGDPLFIDRPAGNFAVSSGSPAIDNGADLSASIPATDIIATSRPQAAAWDIGAYEYIGATPPALVLAMAFDENSGSTPQDISAFGNHGSFGAGVAYTSGKYNFGLNVTSGQVTIPNSNSLSVATGFTVEGWVNLTALTNTWRAVLTKGDAFWLFATSSGGACGNNAITGGFSDAPDIAIHTVCYGTPLTAGTFAYLTLTHDGATLRLYVNAVEVANLPVAEGVKVNSASVLIGASPVGENLSGTIDEVRIYNYARSPAQIIMDRDTSIGTAVIANAPIKLHANAAALKLGAGASILKLAQ